MKRLIYFIAVSLVGVSLSCGTVGTVSRPESGAPAQAPSVAAQERVGFEDRTAEIVGHAERLIDKNQREGAVLDQKWYGFRRFGKYQELFLGAERVLFYGGVEAEIKSHIQDRYLSLAPLDDDRDPGDIRLFAGHLPGKKWDYIAIGQNGREVALKTIIRLIYMAKFADEDMKQKHRARLQAFSKSLRVFMSRVSARSEYLNFFNKHRIRNPDAVLIGFMGDASTVMSQMGFPRPETYSDETLRALWYPNVHGKKVLLISINGNRIYASRCGDLIAALYDISPDSRPAVSFLGSGGSVDAPEMVGKIVAPIRVMSGDPFPTVKNKGAVAYLLRNRAVDLLSIQSVHASVESVVVETTEWAKQMTRRRVKTVDQELYHIAAAINASARGADTPFYAGILITDNVSDEKSGTDVTLEQAEQTIAQTAELRKQFLLAMLKRTGIFKDATEEPIRENQRRTRAIVK
jgi:hypothetical protein